MNGRSLVVVHYHFRPGGVRRVIERALPEIVRQGSVERVIFFGAEAVPEVWLEGLARMCPGVVLESVVEPEAGYVSELGRKPAVRALQATLRRLLHTEVAAIWLHNPALGRNPFLVRETVRLASGAGLPVLLHHHDFWCDNRWQRWPELARLGYRHPDDVAEDLFPASPGVLHVTLTSRDARLLQRGGLSVATWPNSFDVVPPASRAQRQATRRWLREKTGAGPGTRFWVLPCRLLRRKNILEALYRCRTQDPGAVLVTSGQPSSAEEIPYARWLQRQCRRSAWPLHFLQPDPAAGVDHWLAAADVVALTSLQEGFGLAFLEACAAARPLVCRRLPGVAEDLARLGFAFPHAYEETLVDCAAFACAREKRWQAAAWERWRAGLPEAFRDLAQLPPLLAAENPQQIAFSRLSAHAQAEVLGQDFPVAASAARPSSAPPWPEGADALSGPRYAQRFWRAVRAMEKPLARNSASANPAQSQRELAANRLQTANLYPLLWQTTCP